MNLYIDIGNTRVKWQVLPKQKDSTLNAFYYDVSSINTLMEDSLSILDISQLKNVYISNVAGHEIKSKVIQWFVDRIDKEPQFAVSNDKIQHLINSYKHPETLGVDRLLAMLAASQNDRKSCVIVDCGTATTIDCVSSENIFLGGLILPGLGLMQSTLISNTKALTTSYAAKKVTTFAVDTDTAVYSGAVLAITKVIENSLRELSRTIGTEAHCIITGGDGQIIQTHLKCAAKYKANLVLEGLFIYFQAK